MTRNKLIGLAVLAIVVVLGFKSCSSDPKPKQVVVQQQAPVQQAPVIQPAPVQQEQPQVVYQDEQAPQYDQQQPNVVVVQQPPQTVYQSAPSSGYHSGGIGVDHLAAGALGYMAGKNSANNQQRYAPRTRTIIRERTIVRPAPRSYYGSRPAARSFSRPSRSYSFGSRSRSFSRRR